MDRNEYIYAVVAEWRLMFMELLENINYDKSVINLDISNLFSLHPLNIYYGGKKYNQWDKHYLDLYKEYISDIKSDNVCSIGEMMTSDMRELLKSSMEDINILSDTAYELMHKRLHIPYDVIDDPNRAEYISLIHDSLLSVGLEMKDLIEDYLLKFNVSGITLDPFEAMEGMSIGEAIAQLESLQFEVKSTGVIASAIFSVYRIKENERKGINRS